MASLGHNELNMYIMSSCCWKRGICCNHRTLLLSIIMLTFPVSQQENFLLAHCSNSLDVNLDIKCPLHILLYDVTLAAHISGPLCSMFACTAVCGWLAAIFAESCLGGHVGVWCCVVLVFTVAISVNIDLSAVRHHGPHDAGHDTI